MDHLTERFAGSSKTPEGPDWFAHGMDWAITDAFTSPDAEWVTKDVAEAFAAGAKAALAYIKQTEGA